MSGPETALVAIGVLAAVAVLGVGVLLVQTRRLRAELASVSTPARQSPATSAPPALKPESIRPDPWPSREVVRRTPDATVVAPSHQQIVVATLGHPLVRVAALGHGVRRALTPENRDRIAALVRRDLRRREKLRRRAARRAARVLPLDTSDGDRRDLAS